MTRRGTGSCSGQVRKGELATTYIHTRRYTHARARARADRVSLGLATAWPQCVHLARAPHPVLTICVCVCLCVCMCHADLALNIVYTVEMLLRILAAGAPWVLSYLNRPWNAFDASMVVIGYTVFIPTDSGNTSAIRALRALRALRPLRTITRFESLRGVVVCFMEVCVWGLCCGTLTTSQCTSKDSAKEHHAA